MEQKDIDIYEILKGMPYGTPLYTPMCGNVEFTSVEEDKEKSRAIWTENKNGAYSFDKHGKWMKGGEVLLFPSKEMRDWRKFAWKKGDVLTDEERFVVFKDFNTDYTEFSASFEYKDGAYRQGLWLVSNDFRKVSDNIAQEIIKKVEEHYGGKLNLETLEIEKQPEFKDGDIVCISGMGYLAYGIVKSINNSSKKLEYYVLNDMSTLKFEDWLSFEDKQIQPITETQQIILFEALAKKGKRWNAENKQIEDLFKKYEFKPMDWCLMKDSTKYWELCQFAYTRKVHGTTIYSAVGGLIYYKCIPYNEETKHLLGTTDEWKGGK